MRAFVSSWAERLPLRINSSSWARSSALNRTTYFLTEISFTTTNHLHRRLAATEIQKLPSFSITGATREFGFSRKFRRLAAKSLVSGEEYRRLELEGLESRGVAATLTIWRRGSSIEIFRLVERNEKRRVRGGRHATRCRT